MDTVGDMDGKQTTKAPNFSDVLKAMSQARPVPIQRMAAIGIKGGTDVPGEIHYPKQRNYGIFTENASTHSNLSKLKITKAIAGLGTTGNFMPIKSTETGQFPNEDLPLEARKFYLFPDLKHALVSIGLF